jgi:hypothetical protein
MPKFQIFLASFGAAIGTPGTSPFIYFMLKLSIKSIYPIAGAPGGIIRNRSNAAARRASTVAMHNRKD